MPWTTRVVSSLDAIVLGDPGSALSFHGRPGKAAWTARRLQLDGKDAFDLTFWCGTCPLVFERLEGANRTLSSDELQVRLNEGVTSIDQEVLGAVSKILPPATYLPLLLTVRPTLVTPGDEADYFAHEQVEHSGIDHFWGLPHYPKTQYYRSGSGRRDTHSELFEFFVPMVPPGWNDRDRVLAYEAEIQAGAEPTVLALSILDTTQPFDSSESHTGLIHFVLDGHHKLEAAARLGVGISVLSLLSMEESLAGDAETTELARLMGLLD